MTWMKCVIYDLEYGSYNLFASRKTFSINLVICVNDMWILVNLFFGCLA